MALFLQILVGLSAVLSLSAVIGVGYALLRAETPRLLACEARQRELEIEVQALRNAYESTKESLKRINSRYVMRERRAKGSNGSDVPDPQTDPEGWRAAMQTKYPRGVFDYGKGNG